MKLALSFVVVASSVAAADPCPTRTTATVARSQEEVATATSLFQKGIALQGAGKIDEACKMFEGSLHLNPLIGTRLNVAECHELRGRLIEAHALFAETADEAARAGDRRAAYAKTRTEALEAKLVRVSLTMAEPPPGLAIAVASCPVAVADAAVPRVAMPGTIVVDLTAPGRKPSRLERVTAPGDVVVIDVPALTPYANPEEERKAREAEALAAVERRKAEQLVTERELVKVYDQHPARRWALVGGGVGVATFITGAVFGVVARRAQAEYDDTGCGDPTQLVDAPTYASCLDLRDRGQRSSLLANVLLIGGTSLVAAAAIVYVVDPGNIERPRTEIAVSARGAQLVLTW
jgi:hypothetical protein